MPKRIGMTQQVSYEPAARIGSACRSRASVRDLLLEILDLIDFFDWSVSVAEFLRQFARET